MMFQRFGNQAWRATARTSFTCVLSVALFAPVAITFNRHVVGLTYIQGESMYPFFNEDIHQTTKADWTVNNRWMPSQDLRRGMVVTLM